MTKYVLNQRSEHNLQEVHPDLIRIVRLALNLSPIEFRVIEGVRTESRQRAMVTQGSSQTLNSRHLTGHAIDIVPWVNSTVPWSDWGAFNSVAQSMKEAAEILRIKLIWGGDWKTIKDGPHFELSREAYP